MEGKKIESFMKLAGQKLGIPAEEASPELRCLGAQLLLSETLEYVIKGLGVIPSFNGTEITDANALTYRADKPADRLEMLDGLSDVAYTMYWNAIAYGLKLESAFESVCDNNLEKFVSLDDPRFSEGPLERGDWDCARNITWPQEVVSVEVIKVDGALYAVGKDKNGKVRKPSSYTSVDLSNHL